MCLTPHLPDIFTSSLHLRLCLPPLPLPYNLPLPDNFTSALHLRFFLIPSLYPYTVVPALHLHICLKVLRPLYKFAFALHRFSLTALPYIFGSTLDLCFYFTTSPQPYTFVSALHLRFLITTSPLPYTFASSLQLRLCLTI